MTNVNYTGRPAAAPPAQPMMEESADPPTIKNAGRLSPGYGSGTDIFGFALIALMFGLVAIGPLLQAVLTSHGRTARGMALNAGAGAAALALFVGVSAVMGGGDYYWEGILDFALMLGAFWLFLAILAATVGRALRPRSLR
jgi:hypothetical protein